MADKVTNVDVKSDQKSNEIQPFDWEPMRALRHQFDRLLQDFDWPDFRFGRPARWLDIPNLLPDVSMSLPAVDLLEQDGGYDLAMEVPGLTRDQIEVKLSDGMLSIHGEKSAEKVEDTAQYRLKERSFGSISRSFRLPAGVDGKQISAKLENGVLKIHLPKSPEALAKERKIEIKAA